jgi:hypothetical protein
MKIKFEDKIDVIEAELNKKRERWKFNFVHDVDFDDVKQIILIHISKKWDKWDQERPIEPWLSKVINHQINNLIRNTFGKLAPPCYGCPFNMGGDECLFCSSGIKSQECSQFSKWTKTKKGGYDMRMAVSIDSPDYSERNDPHAQVSQVESIFDEFHKKMRGLLSGKYLEAYQILYVDGKSEEYLAKKFKFTTNESKRKPGYRQIANIKREILQVAKKHLPEFELFNLE